MTGWIISAFVLLGLFVFLIMLRASDLRNSPIDIRYIPSHLEIMDPKMKIELGKMENRVFNQANTIIEMSRHEIDIAKSQACDRSNDPLNESAILNSIYQKVEEIKKLSGEY